MDHENGSTASELSPSEFIIKDILKTVEDLLIVSDGRPLHQALQFVS